MPSRLGSTLIKIAVGSLIIGLLLSFFNVSPENFLKGLGDTGLKIFEMLSGIIEWAVKYEKKRMLRMVPGNSFKDFKGKPSNSSKLVFKQKAGIYSNFHPDRQLLNGNILTKIEFVN